MNKDSSPRIALARSLAKKILKELHIQHCPIVLNDIVRHLKKTYKLKVFSSELGQVDGIQVTYNGTITIGYNESHHPNRQRFTVAHEIGHLLLGHTHSGSTYDLKNRDPHETEANQFAAELLMPSKILKDDYGYGSISPKDLAKVYSVSEETIWWRLMECKIIK